MILTEKLQDAYAIIIENRQSVLVLFSFKFKKFLLLRANLLSKQFMKLNKEILNVDEEVLKFEGNSQQPSEIIPPESPIHDWFDMDEFPPLATHHPP